VNTRRRPRSAAANTAPAIRPRGQAGGPDGRGRSAFRGERTVSAACAKREEKHGHSPSGLRPTAQNRLMASHEPGEEGRRR
jgi:hypothetical protein